MLYAVVLLVALVELKVLQVLASLGKQLLRMDWMWGAQELRHLVILSIITQQ